MLKEEAEKLIQYVEKKLLFMVDYDKVKRNLIRYIRKMVKKPKGE